MARASFIIRPIEERDRAGWEPLWQGYLKFYKTSLSDDVTDMTWARFFNPQEQLYALVAEQDRRLIGIAHYLLHRSTWARQCYCYLEDLYLDENIRGGGAGRALIEAVESAAMRAGASRLHWMTHQSNARAQMLYNDVAERSKFIQYRKQL